MVGVELYHRKFALTVLADMTVTLKCRHSQRSRYFSAKFHVLAVMRGSAIHKAKLLPAGDNGRALFFGHGDIESIQDAVEHWMHGVEQGKQMALDFSQ